VVQALPRFRGSTSYLVPDLRRRASGHRGLLGARSPEPLSQPGGNAGLFSAGSHAARRTTGRGWATAYEDATEDLRAFTTDPDTLISD